MNNLIPPVITIDGPSGSGKSTLCKKLSKKLKWDILESGLMYRIFAFLVLKKKIIIQKNTIKVLKNNFLSSHKSENLIEIFSKYKNSSNKITLHDSKISNFSSKIAVLPHVRKFLLKQQLLCRKFPGLITNGRDTGTVVFPDAMLKFYLHANLKERVKRRFLELKKNGSFVEIKELEEEMLKRDLRDQNRKISPLKPAKNAIILDSTFLNAEQIFLKSMQYISQCIKI